MLNIKKLLTKVLQKLNTHDSEIAAKDSVMIETKELSSVTLAQSGGTADATGSVAKTGYEPLGIVGIQKGGGGSGQVIITAYRLVGTNVSVSLYNLATASRTVTTTVYVLYKSA